MNTYDPMDTILCPHMTRDNDPYAVPVASGRTNTRLPAGYANKSRQTRLRGASCS